MTKVIAATLSIIFIAVIYQNCDGGSANLSKSSKLANLTLRFDNSQQYQAPTLTNLILEGQCNVSGYNDHRVDWEYTYNGTIYRGRTERPCSSATSRFMLVIGISHLARTVDSFVNLTGILTGIKGSVLTPGSTSAVRVTFSTGGTSGDPGNTGNTGCTGTFCSMCPEDVAAGAVEYCSSDVNFNAYCASITYPPDVSGVVHALAGERPDLIQSCARNASENPNWNAFTSELIRRLNVNGENRWGFNGVRGNINDINGDTISWWGAPGAPQEGQMGNVVIDVVESCGGANNPTFDVLNAYCGCCTHNLRWTRGL